MGGLSPKRRTLQETCAYIFAVLLEKSIHQGRKMYHVVQQNRWMHRSRSNGNGDNAHYNFPGIRSSNSVYPEYGRANIAEFGEGPAAVVCQRHLRLQLRVQL